MLVIPASFKEFESLIYLFIFVRSLNRIFVLYFTT